MKNLFVLPTDKPSRVFITNAKSIADNLEVKINIYITSENEDINENDYVITKDGRLFQVSYLLSKKIENASKVVLTTDKDLIADGVQSIPDEFLEWFVKNPSCEEVEINPLLSNNGRALFGYKIIIPKEEKDYTALLQQVVTKQETSKEIAERYYEDEVSINGFINGYKLAQEQIIDFLHSEITERRDYSASKMCEKVIEFIEQFKNK